MKWAEVITVRSTDGNSKSLTSALRNLVEDVDTKHRREHIRLYQRKGVDSDFCLVLFHYSRTHVVENCALRLN